MAGEYVAYIAAVCGLLLLPEVALSFWHFLWRYVP